MFKYYLYSLLLFFVSSTCLLCGMEEKPIKLYLKGFLDKSKLEPAQKILTHFYEQPHSLIIIELNSNSGDLVDVLDFAKSLYILKQTQQQKIIVYLNDVVTGPAAIIPFLADEMYGSLVFSWGDIPGSAERDLPTNILRNQVRSLIDSKNPHASTLFLLADGMTDPFLQVNDKIEAYKKSPYALFSSEGQTLVVNQNQLKYLGIVDALLPLKDFEKKYLFESIDQKSKTNTTDLSTLSLEQKLQKEISFKSKNNKIGYLYVGNRETSINESTWLYIKQGLEYYKKNPPLFIILELDTPGGEVFAAQKISDALKEMDLQYNIPIVTFINNWAISAGAMLAYSTRFISAVKGASMGAAEPVYTNENGKMESASEKINSALRADFANRAKLFDRNPFIAEAMVDKDIILVWRHGKILKLENENQIRLGGKDPDQVITGKGKLLTLDAEQMKQYEVADLVLAPQKLSSITEEEKAKGKWSADKMLLFHASFFSQIPHAEIDAYRMDWKTQFFVFLATPLVSSLLMMGLLIGGYIEINNPGFGVPGSIATICLFLMVLSSFSLQIANWLEVILLLSGLGLILIELFILPSFGLLGIMGGLLFLFGLFGLLIPGVNSIHFEYDTQTFNAAGQYLIKRLVWFCGTLILSSIVIALLAQYVLPKFSGLNKFVLKGFEQEGYIAGNNPLDFPQPLATGKVLTPLKPAGKILVQEKIYEAISSGGFIEAETSIEIVRLEGNLIIVRPLINKNIL
ncbi:NfeD family protein [Candidatus Protochlamydia amoebophila]|uniref:Uncharacterized protein n=1 Tax=Protochlamydia amoebophila (strain UWE25) TaxID=264201 RepID=Q6MAD6_PARUW|nr:NfeD family protein [Candidatus Protochlamydia amoebophila]CAF24463.1 unnamed protein product [Candidatus Protochlamydia amoebophila UWE25]